MASRLFALDGVQVAEVDAEAGGGRTVWVVTADPQVAACPGCGTVSQRVKGYVTTRPADLRHGQDRVAVRWVKRRLECREPSPAQDVHRVGRAGPAALPGDGAAA